jgi:TnpA family transposase
LAEVDSQHQRFVDKGWVGLRDARTSAEVFPMAVSPSILSPQLRARFFNPPADHDEAQRRYALTPDDLALCKRHRRQHNRLGFAVQLALIRDLGRPLRLAEHVPTAVVETVGEQIGITPAIFELYARRDETRREHVGEIIACLGLRTIR